MAGDRTPVISGTLGIHVLSVPMGESIVVTLPDGKWFVVDAFSYRLEGSRHDSAHAVLSFLDQFSLEAEDCAFVLLTHLHLDHYEGVPRLLRELRKHNEGIHLVRHAAYGVPGLLARIGQHWKEEYENLDDQLETWHIGARAYEIVEHFPTRCYGISHWNPVYTNANCHVRVVAPASPIVNSYYSPNAFSGPNAKLRKKRPAAIRDLLASQNKILNNMSVAICIMFGETCILLSGDCEAEAWNTLASHRWPPTRTSGLADPLGNVSFLKLPHHGSKRVQDPFLEETICARLGEPAIGGIVTHHGNGDNVLPTREGLAWLRKLGVGLAVPNETWLPEDLREDSEELPGFVRIPVSIDSVGTRSRTKAAQRTRKYRQKKKIRPISREVPWVSTSFGSDGHSSGRWFGGSDAVFLPARS